MNLSAAARSLEMSEILEQRVRNDPRWSFRSFSTFFRPFLSGTRKIMGMESVRRQDGGTAIRPSLHFSLKFTTPWSVGAMVRGRKTTMRDQSASVTRWSNASPAKDSSNLSLNFRTGTWNKGSSDCSPLPRVRVTLAEREMGPFLNASTRAGAGDSAWAILAGSGSAPRRGSSSPSRIQARRACLDGHAGPRIFISFMDSHRVYGSRFAPRSAGTG